jgi:hypothetical protein
MDRQEAQAFYLQKHAAYLDSIKARKNQFVVKTKYPSKALAGQECISLFPFELNKTEDIYIQLTDFDFNSTDDRLFAYKHNKHWEEEYTQNQWMEKSQVYTYNVPLELLQPVEEAPAKKKEAQKSFEFNAEFIDTDADAMMSQMTMRDFIAIMSQKPVSKKTWLNDVIKQISK